MTSKKAPEAVSHLCVLQSFEDDILAGYGAMAASFAGSYHNAFGRRTRADYYDFFQEASLSLYDALYLFDGSSEFSTYAHRGIRRRLFRYCTTKIAENKTQPVSFTPELERVVGRDQADIDFVAAELVKEAMAEADLTDVERAVLDDLMQCGAYVQRGKRPVKKLVCQSTRKPYSRQHLYDIKKKACKKVKTAYNRLKQRKAA